MWGGDVVSIRASNRNHPNSKYAREVLRRLPKGYSIAFAVQSDDGGLNTERAVGKHPCVFCPDGSILRSTEGIPVRICGTPGSRHSFVKDLTDIKRAGVQVTM